MHVKDTKSILTSLPQGKALLVTVAFVSLSQLPLYRLSEPCIILWPERETGKNIIYISNFYSARKTLSK